MLFLIVAVFVSITAVSQVTQYEQSAQSTNSTPVIYDNYLVISGYVYRDENVNGERDMRENAVENAKIKIDIDTLGYQPVEPTTELTAVPITGVPYVTGIPPTPEVTYAATTKNKKKRIKAWTVKTDNFGFFKYAVPSDELPEEVDVTIELLVPKEYTATSENPVIIEGLNSISNTLLEFGMVKGKNKPPAPECKPKPKRCQNPDTNRDGDNKKCKPPRGGWCPDEITVTAVPTISILPCTTDAYVCPDGTSVGRIPPACDFAACPAVTTPPYTTPVACTTDALVCPDGTSVGRVPPSCEFASCPASPTGL